MSQQLKLIELQAVDVTLDQLKHKLATLPETKAVADLQATYSDLEIQVGTAQAAVADTGREVKKAEDAVEQVRARIDKDRNLLDSGSVSSAKQLEELQKEVASLERRQSDLEDEQLEVMEAAESAETDAQDLTDKAAKVAADLESAKSAEEAAKAELAEQTSAAQAQRATVAAEVGANDLSTLYEKLRADNGGVVAALLKGERCGACNLQLSPVDVKALQDSPEDEVHRCDECRSILVLGGEA